MKRPGASSSHEGADRARSLGMGLATVAELVGLLRQNGRWWMIPMLGIFLGAALLLVIVQAAEYIAPFVYTVF